MLKVCKIVIIARRPLIERNIVVVCGDSLFNRHGGMVCGFVEYDVVFRALIVLQRKGSTILRF